MSIYCVYLTIYYGNKLPPFYIGSCKTSHITEKNYHGSVSSQRYKKVWKDEIKNNPNLFKTVIISYFDSDEKARERELFFQEKLNVVKSPMYINESKARKNGFFGRDVSGEKNPRYGFKWKDKHPKGFLGHNHSDVARRKISQAHKGKFAGEKNPMFGVKYSEERKKMVSERLKGNQYLKNYKHPKVCCIECKKELARNTLSRHYSMYHS